MPKVKVRQLSWLLLLPIGASSSLSTAGVICDSESLWLGLAGRHVKHRLFTADLAHPVLQPLPLYSKRNEGQYPAVLLNIATNTSYIKH